MSRITRSLRSANSSTRADGRLQQEELPTLRRDYNFLRSDILDDDITFSRSSLATQRNSEGKICYAPHNLLIRSERMHEWSQYTYNGGSQTWTDNQTDPFGGTNAQKVVGANADPSAGGWLNTREFTTHYGAHYILSVWMKGVVGGEKVRIDLRNGSSAGVTGETYTLSTEWKRYTQVITSDHSGTRGFQFRQDSSLSVHDFFVYGAQAEQTFDSSAISAGTYNYTNDSAYNGPRLDFDHAASLSKDITESNKKGLLIEEARTNLQPNSSLWVVATHAINNFNAITNNFAISPTGARDAWRGECYDTGGAARHEFYARYNKANATQYTHSLYIKPFGTVTHLKGSDEGSTSRGACFDLVNCQVVSNGLSNQGATIEKVTEDGWVRVSFTFTSVAANTDSYLYWAVGDEASLVSGNSVFANYNPGKGQGVYVWGVQSEVSTGGPYASSFMPTYGSTATRAADVATVESPAFNRFYKQGTGGAWLVDSTELAEDRTTQASPFAVYESNSSSLRIGQKVGGGTTNTIAAYYQDGGDMIYSAGGSLGTVTKGVKSKIGITFQTNDGAFTRDGKNPNVDTSIANIYSPTELRIGQNKEASPTTVFCGHIARIRYYNKRISNSKLQKQTSTDFLLNRFPRAKAAHSLRALMDDSTNSPVTRIRREYDSFEADYTAAQVANGDLEKDFRSADQTTLPLDVSVEADEMVTGGDFTNLITNGTFDTDTNWTKGTGWSIASGVAASDGSQSSNSGLIQYNVHTSGKTYTLTFDVVSTNSEPIKFWVNGVQNIFTSALGVGTHTYTYTAQHTGTAYFEATADFVGSIDNVSVVEGSWNIGSVWNISNGGISYDDSAVGNINTAVTLKKGRTYTVAFDVTSGTTPYIWLGNSAGSYSYDGRSYATRNIGHHTETFTMTSDQTTLAFYGSTSGTAFTIDNVSLKEVNPKATGYSCRKINSDYTGYAMRVRNNDDSTEAELSFDENNQISLDSPVKATSMNLMPISENFAEVNMNASATVEGGQSDPFGGNNAYKLKATSTNYSGITPQITGITAGDYYTISAYMKAGTSTLSRIGIYDNNTNPFWINVDVAWSALGVPSTSASVGASNINYEEIGTDGWYRVSFTGQALATDGNQYFQIHADRNATSKNVLIYGIQLEETVYEDTGTELITNGDFSNGSTDWDISNTTGGTIEVTDGALRIASTNASSNYTAASQDTYYAAGKKYKITFDLTINPANEKGLTLVTPDGNSHFSTSGSKSVELVASSTAAHSNVFKRKNAGFVNDFTIDNVSILEYDPVLQPYTQTPVVSDAHNSTSATNLREFAGKENRLSYSEDFSQYSSDGNRLTVENSTGTTPIGNTYAELTVNTDASAEKNLYLNQNFTIKAGETYVASVYVRNNSIIDSSDGENRAQLWLQRNGGGTYEGTGVTIPVSSEWQRVSVSHTFAHNQTGLRAKVVALTDADQGSIEVTGFQVNTDSLKDYQVTSGSPKTADVHVVNWYNQGGGEDATQDTASQQPRIVMGSELVTDNGKPSIRFDGVDDNLKIEGEPTLKSAFWYANVLEQNSSNDQSYAQVLYGTGSWAYAAYFTTSTNISYYGWYLDNGWRQGDPDPVMGNGHVISQINSGTRDVYFNGNQTLNHATTTFTDGVGGMIGARDYGGGTHRNLDGNLSELLLYPSDMSSSRFQIEQNIINYFDVGLIDIDFEDGITGVEKSGSSTIGDAVLSAETTNPISGTQSLKVAITGGNNNSYPRIFTTGTGSMSEDSEIGTKYRVTFDTKLISGTVKLVGLGFADGSTAGKGFLDTNQGSDDVVLAGSQSHSFENTITELTSNVSHRSRLFFSFKGTEGDGVFLIDNIKIKKLGVTGFVTTLYDQAGNNCHAVQATASNQPQIVAGGDLIKSGNHPAWDFVAGSPQRNLVIQGLTGIDPIDAFFVQEANDNQYIYPSSTSGSYYGWVALDGSSGVDVIRGSYGAPVLEVNGSAVSLSTEDDVHTALNGRKLVYHRSARTTSWPEVNIGNTFSTNHAWNLEDFKFSEMIWYDSDQHSNQSGIESNINDHYNIY